MNNLNIFENIRITVNPDIKDVINKDIILSNCIDNFFGNIDTFISSSYCREEILQFFKYWSTYDNILQKIFEYYSRYPVIIILKFIRNSKLTNSNEMNQKISTFKNLIDYFDIKNIYFYDEIEFEMNDLEFKYNQLMYNNYEYHEIEREYYLIQCCKN